MRRNFARGKKRVTEVRKNRHKKLLDEALDKYLIEAKTHGDKLIAKWNFNALLDLYAANYGTYENSKLTSRVRDDLGKVTTVKVLTEQTLKSMSESQPDIEMESESSVEVSATRAMLFDINQQWARVMVGSIPSQVEETYRVVMGNDLVSIFKRDLLQTKYFMPIFRTYLVLSNEVNSEILPSKELREKLQTAAGRLLYRLDYCASVYPEWYAENQEIFNKVKNAFPKLDRSNNYGLGGTQFTDEQRVKQDIQNKLKLMSQKIALFRNDAGKHSPLSAEDVQSSALSLSLAHMVLECIPSERTNVSEPTDVEKRRDEIKRAASNLVDIMLEKISCMTTGIDPLSEIYDQLYRYMTYVEVDGATVHAFPLPKNTFTDNFMEANSSPVFEALDNIAKQQDLILPKNPLGTFIYFILRFGTDEQRRKLDVFFQLSNRKIPLMYSEEGHFFAPHIKGVDWSDLPTEGQAHTELINAMQPLSAILVAINLLSDKTEQLTLQVNREGASLEVLAQLPELERTAKQLDELQREALNLLEKNIEGKNTIAAYFSQNRARVLELKEQLESTIPKIIQQATLEWKTLARTLAKALEEELFKRTDGKFTSTVTAEQVDQVKQFISKHAEQSIKERVAEKTDFAAYLRRELIGNHQYYKDQIQVVDFEKIFPLFKFCYEFVNAEQRVALQALYSILQKPYRLVDQEALRSSVLPLFAGASELEQEQTFYAFLQDYNKCYPYFLSGLVNHNAEDNAVIQKILPKTEYEASIGKDLKKANEIKILLIEFLRVRPDPNEKFKLQARVEGKPVESYDSVVGYAGWLAHYGDEETKKLCRELKQPIIDFSKDYTGSAKKAGELTAQTYPALFAVMDNMDIDFSDTTPQPSPTIAFKRWQYLYVNNPQVFSKNPSIRSQADEYKGTEEERDLQRECDLNFILSQGGHSDFIRQVQDYLAALVQDNEFDEIISKIPNPIQRDAYVYFVCTFDTDGRRAKLVSVLVDKLLTGDSFSEGIDKEVDKAIAILESVNNPNDRIAFRQLVESKLLCQLASATRSNEFDAYYQLCLRWGYSECQADALTLWLDKNLSSKSTEDLLENIAKLVAQEPLFYFLQQPQLQTWLTKQIQNTFIPAERKQKLDGLVVKYGTDEQKCSLIAREFERCLNEAAAKSDPYDLIGIVKQKYDEVIKSASIIVIDNALQTWLQSKFEYNSDELTVGSKKFPHFYHLVLAYGTDEQRFKALTVKLSSKKQADWDKEIQLVEVENKELFNKKLQAWQDQVDKENVEFNHLCVLLQYAKDEEILTYVNEHQKTLKELDAKKQDDVKTLLSERPELELRTYRGVEGTGWRPLAQQVYEILGWNEKKDEYSNWLSFMLENPESSAGSLTKQPELTKGNISEFHRINKVQKENPSKDMITDAYGERNARRIFRSTRQYVSRVSISSYVESFFSEVGTAAAKVVKGFVAGLSSFASNVKNFLFGNKSSQKGTVKPQEQMNRYDDRMELVTSLAEQEVSIAVNQLKRDLGQHQETHKEIRSHQKLSQYTTLVEEDVSSKIDTELSSPEVQAEVSEQVKKHLGKTAPKTIPVHDLIDAAKRFDWYNGDSFKVIGGIQITEEIAKGINAIVDPIVSGMRQKEGRARAKLLENQLQVAEYVRHQVFNNPQAKIDDLSELVKAGVPELIVNVKAEQGKSNPLYVELTLLLASDRNKKEGPYQIYQSFSTTLTTLSKIDSQHFSRKEIWDLLSNYDIEKLEELFLNLDTGSKFGLYSKLNDLIARIPEGTQPFIKQRLELMANIVDPKLPVENRHLQHSYIAEQLGAYRELDLFCSFNIFNQGDQSVEERLKAFLDFYRIPKDLAEKERLAKFADVIRKNKDKLLGRKEALVASIDELFRTDGIQIIEVLDKHGLTSDQQSQQCKEVLFANQKAEELEKLLKDETKWKDNSAEAQMKALMQVLSQVNRYADKSHRGKLRGAIEERVKQVLGIMKDYMERINKKSHKSPNVILPSTPLQLLQKIYMDVYRPHEGSIEEDKLQSDINQTNVDTLHATRIRLNTSKTESAWLKKCDGTLANYETPVNGYLDLSEKFFASGLHFVNAFGSETDKREMQFRIIQLPYVDYMHYGSQVGVKSEFKIQLNASDAYFGRQENLGRYLDEEEKPLLKTFSQMRRKTDNTEKHNPVKFVEAVTKEWVGLSVLSEMHYNFIKWRDHFSYSVLTLAQNSMVEPVADKLSTEISFLRNELVQHGLNSIKKAIDKNLLSSESIRISENLCKDNYPVRILIKKSAKHINAIRSFEDPANQTPEKYRDVLKSVADYLIKHERLLILLARIGKLERFVQALESKGAQPFDLNALKIKVRELKDKVAKIKPDKGLEKELQQRDLRNQILEVDEAVMEEVKKVENAIKGEENEKKGLKAKWDELEKEKKASEEYLQKYQAQIIAQHALAESYVSFLNEHPELKTDPQKAALSFKAHVAVTTEGPVNPGKAVRALAQIASVVSINKQDVPESIKQLEEKGLSIKVLEEAILFSNSFFQSLSSLLEKIGKGSVLFTEFEKLSVLIKDEGAYFIVSKEQKKILDDLVKEYKDSENFRTEQAKELIMLTEKAMTFQDLISNSNNKEEIAKKEIRKEHIVAINKELLRERALKRVDGSLNQFLRELSQPLISSSKKVVNINDDLDVFTETTLSTLGKMTPEQLEQLDKIIKKLKSKEIPIPIISAKAAQNLIDAVKPEKGFVPEEKAQEVKKALESLATEYAAILEEKFKNFSHSLSLNEYLSEIEDLTQFKGEFAGQYYVVAEFGNEEAKKKIADMIAASAEPYLRVLIELIKDPNQRLDSLLAEVNRTATPPSSPDVSDVRFSGFNRQHEPMFGYGDLLEEEPQSGYALLSRTESVFEQGRTIQITAEMLGYSNKQHGISIDELDPPLTLATLRDKLRQMNRVPRQLFEKTRKESAEVDRNRLIELEVLFIKLDSNELSQQSTLSKVRTTIIDLMLNGNSFNRLRMGEILLDYLARTEELRNELPNAEKELVEYKNTLETQIKKIQTFAGTEQAIAIIRENIKEINNQIAALPKKQRGEEIRSREVVQGMIHELFPDKSLQLFYFDAALEPQRVTRTHQEAYQPISNSLLELKEKMHKKAAMQEQVKKLREKYQLKSLTQRSLQEEFNSTITELQRVKVREEVKILIESEKQGENASRIKTQFDIITNRRKILPEAKQLGQKESYLIDIRNSLRELAKLVPGLDKKVASDLATLLKDAELIVESQMTVIIEDPAKIQASIVSLQAKLTLVKELSTDLRGNFEKEYKEELKDHNKRLVAELSDYYRSTSGDEIDKWNAQLTATATSFAHYIEEHVSQFKRENNDFFAEYEDETCTFEGINFALIKDEKLREAIKEIYREVNEHLMDARSDDDTAKYHRMEREARVNHIIAQHLHLYDGYGATLLGALQNTVATIKIVQTEEPEAVVVAIKSSAIAISTKKSHVKEEKSMAQTFKEAFEKSLDSRVPSYQPVGETFKGKVVNLDKCSDVKKDKVPQVIGTYVTPFLIIDGKTIVLDGDIWTRRLDAELPKPVKQENLIKLRC